MHIRITPTIIAVLLIAPCALASPPDVADTGSKTSQTIDDSILSSSKKYDPATLDALFLKADEELKKNPMAPESHLKLGEAFQVRGDFSQAEREYKLAINLSAGRQNPTAQKLLNNLGSAHKKYVLSEYERKGSEDQARKNFPAAEASWKRALQIEPQSAVRWVRLGSLYQEMGQASNAALCYKQALKFDANNDAAKKGIATTEHHFRPSTVWQRNLNQGSLP